MDYAMALKQLVIEERIQPDWMCGDTYESIVCEPKPTDEELQEAYQRWFQQNDYLIKRKGAYPSVADQLEIMHSQGFDAWKEVIQLIKDQYPAPQ